MFSLYHYHCHTELQIVGESQPRCQVQLEVFFGTDLLIDLIQDGLDEADLRIDLGEAELFG